ncbi:MAG: glycerophosphodiester phosphodiesterase [Victivallales bacterium]|nr:glycerophosphodiester phosphodiesterase [Victivallales bacterium]
MNIPKTQSVTTHPEADAAFKRFFSIPFERKAMDVLYSVVSNYHGKGRVWGNTEMHFRKGVEEGFDAFKADMRLSKDGEIVLCHDEGFTYDDKGRITRFDKNNYEAIHDMPLEKILKLEYNIPFQGQYLHPCTLDTMLAICEEYGKIAYLTLRPEDWRKDVAKRMAELLVKHNMQHRTIINLFIVKKGADAAKQFVSEYIPGLVFCHTQRGNVPLSKELIDESATVGYQIICLYYANQIDSITPELVQYAADKGIRIWCWGVGKEEQTANCLAKGVSGFQMSSRDINAAVVDKMLHPEK